MPIVVTTERAIVYKVRHERAEGEDQSFAWADAAVRSWNRGGSISIQSDYGTYANTWTATGPGPFIGFLCSLDFDYFMRKACPAYMVFDFEGSVAAIKGAIIEQRRWRAISREFARECWDDLALFAGDGSSNSADYFISEVLRSPALCKFFDGDYADLARYSPNPQARGFWKEIWPHLIAAWRSEMTLAA